MENPLEGMSDPADKKHAITRDVIYFVIGCIALGFVVIVYQNIAASQTAASGTTGTSGTTAGTTDNTAADDASNLTLAQGEAAIQSQEATLANQLQIQLLGAQTTAATTTANDTSQNTINEAYQAAVDQVDIQTNAAYNAEQQAAQASFNTIQQANNTANNTNATNQFIANIQQGNLAFAIQQALGAQQSENTINNNQAIAASAINVSNLTNTLTSFFGYTNGSGTLSGSGSYVPNSLSDATKDFMNLGSGETSVLDTLIQNATGLNPANANVNTSPATTSNTAQTTTNVLQTLATNAFGSNT